MKKGLKSGRAINYPFLLLFYFEFTGKCEKMWKTMKN